MKQLKAKIKKQNFNETLDIALLRLCVWYGKSQRENSLWSQIRANLLPNEPLGVKKNPWYDALRNKNTQIQEVLRKEEKKRDHIQIIGQM